MVKPLTTIIVSVAVAAATLAPLSQAYAGDRGHRHYYNNNWNGANRYHRNYGRYRRPVVVDRYYNDDALLFGVLGLAAGALITGTILNNPGPGYSQPPRDYYPAAPTQTYAAGALEPWTDEWYRYCARKYRSFDASTGTYRGYDGYNHFCVVR